MPYNKCVFDTTPGEAVQVRDVGVHDMHENEEVLERVVGVLAEDDLAQIVVEEVGGARAFRLRFVAQIKTRVLVAGVGGR